MRAAAAGVLWLTSCSTLAADGWLDDLRGEWTGRGRFMGNDAAYTIVIEPALAGQFVRMRVRYTWSDAAGAEASFLGEALYPARGQGMVRGSWFDAEGHQYPTSAYREPGERGDTRGALIVHWGDGSLSGRTEYRPTRGGPTKAGPSGTGAPAADGLEVRDSVKRGAAWQVFSQASLQRASGPG